MSGMSLSALLGPRLTGRARWVDWAARALVAGVFLFAGVPKLLDPASFAEAIENYQLLPREHVGWLAVVLPPLEIAIALALVTGVAKRGAALAAAGMLAVFAVAIGQAVVRGIDIDCGCFGAATEAAASWWSVARNVALIACCAAVLWLGREPAQSP